MSLDFFVFAVGKPIRRPAVAASLEKAGFLVWFAGESDRLHELPDGAVGEDLVLGVTRAELRTEVSRCLAEGDRPALDRMWEAGDLASCIVYTSHPYSAVEEFGQEEIEALAARLPASVVEAMRAATTHYYVRTSAGRSTMSVDLQVAVWRAIGAVSGGLMEDPQGGEYSRTAGGRLEVLVPGEE